MAEVTSTPPPPGTQPNAGQGPQHTTGPRTATDGATSDERQAPHEKATQETETAKARFEPAVAVSPALAHLEPGQEIRGDISRIDGEGRPVLETREADYALEPDANLKKNDNVAILIETVEKQAVGRLIERQGERLETPVRVTLTLVALHQTPEAPRDDEATRREPVPANYSAPASSASEVAAEFDFESSALALPESGIPAHGAAPGHAAPQTSGETLAEAAAAAATAAPAETYALVKGKKVPATLTGSLLSASELSGDSLPAAPGATSVYAQAFGEPNAAAESLAQSGTANKADPTVTVAVATPSLPQASLVGGPTGLALPKILQPGSQLTARLVAATDGAPVRYGLGDIKPGDSISLTVLAQGAEHSSLLQSQAFVGIITSAAEIAASAMDVTGLGLVSGSASDDDKAVAAEKPAEKLARNAPEGIERRAGERTGQRSDGHYIKSPAGAFLFRAAEKLAIGTRITLTATPAPVPNVSGPPITSLTQAALVNAQATQAPTSSQETASTTAAMGSSPLAPLAPLVSYQTAWPLVDEMLEAMAAADPAAAKAAAPRISAPGARLSSGLIFFLSALRLQSPRAWIGEQAARALEAKGNGGLLSRLKEEFARLGRLSADRPGADWRPFLIPLQTESGTQAIALLTRPHHDEGDGTPREGPDSDDEEELSENQRFLLEIKLGALGPLQLDGLMRPERLDMVVRAGDGLTHQMRNDLREIFESATGAAGLKGGLSFEPLSRSPVDVARVLAQALPADHDAGAVV